MNALRGRLEALVLLLMGAGSLWLAAGPAYGRLMNVDFRVVTIAGAILLLCMGFALLLRPRRRAGPFALSVFALFYAVMAVGNPFSAGDADALAFQDRPPAAARAGYEPLEVDALFSGLDAVQNVPEGRYVISGIVYRSEALDAQDVFVLLDPLMACCLADAIALGIRVRSNAPPPETGSWVHVYGTLQRLHEPVVTPRFRFGVIVFTTVSRWYRFVPDDIASFRSLLPDVVEQIPTSRCARFRQALEAHGLAQTLRGDGPFTVFAPVDLSFDRLHGRLSARDLEDFVVRGSYTKRDLLALEELTTLSGRTLRVEIEPLGAVLRIEGARILFGDQLARNGVLHMVHPAWFRKR